DAVVEDLRSARRVELEAVRAAALAHERPYRARGPALDAAPNGPLIAARRDRVAPLEARMMRDAHVSRVAVKREPGGAARREPAHERAVVPERPPSEHGLARGGVHEIPPSDEIL